MGSSRLNIHEDISHSEEKNGKEKDELVHEIKDLKLVKKVLETDIDNLRSKISTLNEEVIQIKKDYKSENENLKLELKKLKDEIFGLEYDTREELLSIRQKLKLIQVKEPTVVRPNAKITFVVKNIRKLIGKICSSPVIIQHFNWKIIVTRTEDEINGSLQPRLGFYLHCSTVPNGVHLNPNEEIFSCFAYAKLSILSFDDQCENYSRGFRAVFQATSDGNTYGYEDFIEWDFLINPTKEYIENDNVVLQAYISAETPQNDTYEDENDCYTYKC